MTTLIAGAFRIPEYRWSAQHYRILTELLDALDEDLKNLAHDETLLTSVENQILLHNILHLASQLADNLILATGGVLPILASARVSKLNEGVQVVTNSDKNVSLIGSYAIQLMLMFNKAM